MNIFESFILGLTQGLTEFIPVSSSGHLEIVERLIADRSGDFHLFLEFINLGTLLALLIFYRKRIWGIIVDVFKNKNYKMLINLIITSIPAGLAGILLADLIEELPFFSSMITIAIAIGVIGILMIYIDKLPHLSKLKDENKLTPKRAGLIGLAQVLALIPGTSRSGATIVAGRMVGLDSEGAVNYSFLASIPIMCGVCLKMFLSSTSRAYLFANAGMLVFSNLVAFIAGYFALKFVLKYVKKPNALRNFGIYRVILALVILIVVLIQ